MNITSHRHALLSVLGAMTVLAWLSLWVWEQSPYGRYLHHAQLAGLDTASLAATLTQVAVYVLGWLLMCIAMMLPTTFPLLGAFARLTSLRQDRRQLAGWLVGGYLTAWMAFGIAAHLFDLVLHEGFERIAWLQARPWLFGAAPLLLAGVFQFSDLKYRCLDRCRAPAGFVIQHWRGGAPVWQSFAIGAHHGLYCVGCCWALMLLMFAVGTGSIGWMLALGIIMAIEKNHPWGRWLSAPLGVGLIAWGTAIVMNHAWTWQ